MLCTMERLKRWLEESNTTQASLAERMKVSQPTVSDWINGNTSPTTAKLRTLGEITGLSIDELLSLPKNSRHNNHRVSA